MAGPGTRQRTESPTSTTSESRGEHHPGDALLVERGGAGPAVCERDARRGLPGVNAVERARQAGHREPEQDAQQRQHDGEFDECVSLAAHGP